MLIISRGQTEVGEIKSSYWFVSFHGMILNKIPVPCILMIKKDNKFIIYIFEIHFDLVQREEKNERSPTNIKK